jgi:hypothetical protein
VFRRLFLCCHPLQLLILPAQSFRLQVPFVHAGKSPGMLGFAEKSHAEQFKEAWGGEWFNPNDRSKGWSWMVWNKPVKGP